MCEGKDRHGKIQQGTEILKIKKKQKNVETRNNGSNKKHRGKHQQYTWPSGKKMVWRWRSMNYDQISIKEKKHPIVNNPKNSQNRIWS